MPGTLDLHALGLAYEALPHGQRGPWLAEQARRLGIAPVTLRRRLRALRRPGDPTQRTTSVPDDLLRQIMIVKEQYRSTLLKGQTRQLSTEAALRILAEEGHPDAGRYSVSAVNRALGIAGYREARPRRRVEAAYACQQFQMDFSRSKHFQVLRPEGEDWLLRVTAREMHYKDGAVRLRTWVVQLVDEYSRLRLVRYFPATAESGILGVAFLRWCFQRPDDAHLMRHLPERLRTDQGTFLKSPEGRSLIRALGIQPVLGEAGDAAPQGKVERGFGTLWSQFEAPFATRCLRRLGERATIRLSELNDEVLAFTIEEHQRTHPTRTGLRGALYQQSILRRPPRTVEADLREIAFQTWERRADSTGMIRIEGVPFEVPAYAAGHWVRVYRNLQGHFRGEMIDGYREGQTFDVRPYRFADLDRFEPRGRSVAQVMHTEALRDLQARGDGAGDGAVRPLMPAPDPITPDSPFTRATDDQAPRRLDAFEASAELGRALRAAGLSDNDRVAALRQARLRGLISDGMTRSDLDALIERLTSAIRKAS